MAILYKSDLEKVNSYAEAALSKEAADSDKIINNINSFIASSTNLKGAVWDRERERFSGYLTSLEQRKTVSANLLSAIKEANQIMANYIEGFPIALLSKIPDLSISSSATIEYVDDSWIGEINGCLSRAKTNYQSVEAKEAKTTTLKSTKAKSLEYYKNIIDACNAVIEYLSRLQPTAAEAYSKYAGVTAELATLKAANHELNQTLFDNIPGKKVVEKIVYVSGGGSYSGSNEIPKNDTPTPSQQPSQTTEPVTPVSEPVTPATPISNVTPSVQPVNSGPAPSVNISPIINAPEPAEIVPEEIPEEEPIVTTEPDIVIEPDEPIITPDVEPTVVPSQPRQTSTAKKIGYGVVGAAAVGAAAYGAYKVAEKIKENNDLDEESGEDDYSSSYDDKENININYDDDDI